MEGLAHLMSGVLILLVAAVAVGKGNKPRIWHLVLFVALLPAGLFWLYAQAIDSLYGNPDRPGFVVQGSVYGVIGPREGDTRLVDGEPVPLEVWDGNQLGDTDLQAGGLLLVAEGDGYTYWFAVRPPSEHQIDPTCWEIDGYAWEAPNNAVIFGKGVVQTGEFRWPWEPDSVGLQLPGSLSDSARGEDRMYDGDGFTNDTVACVSRDGTVQSPERTPVESDASP